MQKFQLLSYVFKYIYKSFNGLVNIELFEAYVVAFLRV